ncbi:Hypothetical Protein FCC1311_106262, partial [Hondaea fermentalgiana]
MATLVEPFAPGLNKRAVPMVPAYEEVAAMEELMAKSRDPTKTCPGLTERIDNMLSDGELSALVMLAEAQCLRRDKGDQMLELHAALMIVAFRACKIVGSLTAARCHEVGKHIACAVLAVEARIPPSAVPDAAPFGALTNLEAYASFHEGVVAGILDLVKDVTNYHRYGPADGTIGTSAVRKVLSVLDLYFSRKTFSALANMMISNKDLVGFLFGECLERDCFAMQVLWKMMRYQVTCGFEPISIFERCDFESLPLKSQIGYFVFVPANEVSAMQKFLELSLFEMEHFAETCKVELIARKALMAVGSFLSVQEVEVWVESDLVADKLAPLRSNMKSNLQPDDMVLAVRVICECVKIKKDIRLLSRAQELAAICMANPAAFANLMETIACVDVLIVQHETVAAKTSRPKVFAPSDGYPNLRSMFSSPEASASAKVSTPEQLREVPSPNATHRRNLNAEFEDDAPATPASRADVVEDDSSASGTDGLQPLMSTAEEEEDEWMEHAAVADDSSDEEGVEIRAAQSPESPHSWVDEQDDERDDEQEAEQEAERKAKQEAELKAKQEAERKAKQEAELKAKQEAELKAKQETELKAKQEAELKAKQEAELKAKQEAERKAKQEAELKAKQAAERKAKQEAELKTKQKAELELKLIDELAKRTAELSKKEAELKEKRKDVVEAKLMAALVKQATELNNRKAEVETMLKVELAKLNGDPEATRMANQETELAKRKAEVEKMLNAELAKLNACIEATGTAKQETEREELAKQEAEREAEFAKQKATQDAMQRTAELAKLKADQAAKEQAEQEAKRKAEQEAKLKAAQEAKRKAEQEAKQEEDLRAQLLRTQPEPSPQQSPKAEQQQSPKAEQQQSPKAQQQQSPKAQQQQSPKAQ